MLVLLAVAGVVVWIVRRGRRAGVQAATEACYPLCLALGKVAPDVFGLEALEGVS